jgi:hypothetical protein
VVFHGNSNYGDVNLRTLTEGERASQVAFHNEKVKNLDYQSLKTFEEETIKA